MVIDGGADPAYEFQDFAEFVRKVRIDFDAHVTPFTAAELDQYVPAPVRGNFVRLYGEQLRKYKSELATIVSQASSSTPR